jgi:16S rRNA (guanine527-N7)-methyltransferase
VESDRKKAAFLRDVAAELGLESVTVEARRAEELGHDAIYRERHDVALTRAIARAAVAAEYCLPLVRVGGVLLALAKEDDWRAATPALDHLGGRLRETSQGVVIVDKVGKTPERFPRRVGVPRKRPLS